jgi:ComF family protein
MVFARRCISCERVVKRADIELCFGCASGLISVADGQLQQYLANEMGRGSAPALVAGNVLWYYDEHSAARHLQKRLKYAGAQDLGIHLGRLLGRGIWQLSAIESTSNTDSRSTIESTSNIDAVVPVPLHPIRKIERGYNQAAAIGLGVASALGVPLLEFALQKRHHTASQVAGGRNERFKNLVGAFAVDAAAPIDGRHILIVDDVVTTGATLVSAIRALLEAGANRISVGVLFFVRPEGRSADSSIALTAGRGSQTGTDPHMCQA